jgi:hypothetical protein
LENQTARLSGNPELAAGIMIKYSMEKNCLKDMMIYLCRKYIGDEHSKQSQLKVTLA